jgi:DNA-binding IclR family transcriptional regulator
MAHQPPSSWDRLQAMLEKLTPGDEIHVTAAARQCGLSPATCETVLETLTRMNLFTRHGEYIFVRRRMLDLSIVRNRLIDSR